MFPDNCLLQLRSSITSMWKCQWWLHLWDLEAWGVWKPSHWSLGQLHFSHFKNTKNKMKTTKKIQLEIIYNLSSLNKMGHGWVILVQYAVHSKQDLKWVNYQQTDPTSEIKDSQELWMCRWKITSEHNPWVTVKESLSRHTTGTCVLHVMWHIAGAGSMRQLMAVDPGASQPPPLHLFKCSQQAGGESAGLCTLILDGNTLW